MSLVRGLPYNISNLPRKAGKKEKFNLKVKGDFRYVTSN